MQDCYIHGSCCGLLLHMSYYTHPRDPTLPSSRPLKKQLKILFLADVSYTKWGALLNIVSSRWQNIIWDIWLTITFIWHEKMCVLYHCREANNLSRPKLEKNCDLQKEIISRDNYRWIFWNPRTGYCSYYLCNPRSHLKHLLRKMLIFCARAFCHLFIKRYVYVLTYYQNQTIFHLMIWKNSRFKNWGVWNNISRKVMFCHVIHSGQTRTSKHTGWNINCPLHKV